MKTLMTTAFFSLLSLLPLGTNAAQANVLTYEYCGHLNRSVEICTASAGAEHFIVRLDFNKAPVFMSATVKYLNPGIAGVGAAQYTSTWVGENDGQPSGPATTHQYSLIVRQIIVPNAPISGELSVDGVRISRFDMERVTNVN